MRLLFTALLAAILYVSAASAQIVQFSGAPVPSTTQYLVQQYGTPGLLLSTTKENSAISVNCMTVRRVSDSATQTIGWSGKDCDAATFDTFCLSTTCRLTNWNDQSGNGLDCVQATTTRQPQVLKKADGKLTIRSTSAAQGCEVADNAAIRFATPDLYMVRLHSFLGPGDESTSIFYGPTGVSTNARWGLQWSYIDAITYFPVNASANGQQYGEAVWGGDGVNFFIENYRPATQDMRGSNGFQITTPQSSTNVTYTGTIKLVVGNNLSYNQGWNGEEFRFVALYNTSVSGSNRDAISTFISSSQSQNVPAAAWTKTVNGFDFAMFPMNGYGGVSTTDAFGYTWTYEDGAYLWSQMTATNLASPATTTLTRIEVKPGDFDVVVNAEERSERNLLSNTNPTWQRGGYLSETFSIYFEPGTCLDVGTGWNYNSQHHTGGSGEPDNLTFTIAKNSTMPITVCDQINWITQDGSSTNLRGTPFSFSRSVWYTIVIHAYWSATGTGDTLEIWCGPHGGGTLSKVVNLTTPQHLFWGAPATDANVKQGIYSHNLNTSLAYQLANWQYSLTQNAYTAYITTQPALPTHP